MELKNRFTVWLSSTVGLIYVFVYLNYPEFFVLNPLSSATPTLGALQVTSTFAWVVAAIAPTIFWMVGIKFTSAKSATYLVASLLWPSVISILHVYLYFTSGNAGLVYLVNYPIFILTDIIAPIIYVQMWRKFRTQKTESTLVANNFLFDSTKGDQG